jgi:phage gp46-like protein
MTVGIDAYLKKIPGGLYDLDFVGESEKRILFLSCFNDSTNWTPDVKNDLFDEGVIVSPNSSGSLKFVATSSDNSLNAIRTFDAADFTDTTLSFWIYIGANFWENFNTGGNAVTLKIHSDVGVDWQVWFFDRSEFIKAESWLQLKVNFSTDDPDSSAGNLDFTAITEIEIHAFAGPFTQVDDIMYIDQIEIMKPAVVSGDIRSEDFFDSAILVSLFAESRASESEVFQSHMRRGWIGNESTPGFEIGSKIWLYEQARLTRSVLNGITAAARQSLQWLIDDDYALAIDVEAILTASGVDINIIIYRPNSKIDHRYYTLWDNTGVEVPKPQTYFELTVPSTDLGPLDGTRIVSYNIFDKVGNPSYAVDVIVYCRWPFAGVGAPTMTTGKGWHPDSKITIFNDFNNQILGAGGRGGRGGEVSGNGGVGGGGGGANSFGAGGLPNGVDGVYVVNWPTGGAGSPTGGVEDRDAEPGQSGFPCIEMFHPITFMNNGSISGGCGGGGGGSSEGGDGGEGETHGFQAIPREGEPGTGDNPGVGGNWEYAIITNGYVITYNPEGLIRGGVL